MFAFAGHRTNAHGAVFSPDGRNVLSADGDGTACLWVCDTGNMLHAFATEPMLDIGSALAISHDGQWIAIGGVAGARGPRFLRIWNAMDGALLARSPPNDWGGFCTVAFSPDDRFIATASSDWVARLWDARTGEPLRVFTGHRTWVRSAAFSPDGSQLVTCGADNTIKLWEVASGRELRTIHGHKDQICWAEFSPAGDRLLSASHDQTAMLWDVSSGQVLLTLQGHTAMVTSTRFSPNGQRIATSSFDGTVRVWEASR